MGVAQLLFEYLEQSEAGFWPLWRLTPCIT